MSTNESDELDVSVREQPRDVVPGQPGDQTTQTPGERVGVFVPGLEEAPSDARPGEEAEIRFQGDVVAEVSGRDPRAKLAESVTAEPGEKQLRVVTETGRETTFSVDVTPRSELSGRRRRINQPGQQNITSDPQPESARDPDIQSTAEAARAKAELEERAGRQLDTRQEIQQAIQQARANAGVGPGELPRRIVGPKARGNPLDETAALPSDDVLARRREARERGRRPTVTNTGTRDVTGDLTDQAPGIVRESAAGDVTRDPTLRRAAARKQAREQLRKQGVDPDQFDIEVGSQGVDVERDTSNLAQAVRGAVDLPGVSAQREEQIATGLLNVGPVARAQADPETIEATTTGGFLKETGDSGGAIIPTEEEIRTRGSEEVFAPDISVLPTGQRVRQTALSKTAAGAGPVLLSAVDPGQILLSAEQVTEAGAGVLTTDLDQSRSRADLGETAVAVGRDTAVGAGSAAVANPEQAAGAALGAGVLAAGGGFAAKAASPVRLARTNVPDVGGGEITARAVRTRGPGRLGGRNLVGQTTGRPQLGTPAVTTERVDFARLGTRTDRAFEPTDPFRTDLMRESARQTGGTTAARTQAVEDLMTEARQVEPDQSDIVVDSAEEMVGQARAVPEGAEGDIAQVLREDDVVVFGSAAVRAQVRDFRQPADIDVVVADKAATRARLSEALEGQGADVGDVFDIKSVEDVPGRARGGEPIKFGETSDPPLTVDDVQINPVGEEAIRKAGASGFFRGRGAPRGADDPRAAPERFDVGPQPRRPGRPDVRRKDVADAETLARELDEIDTEVAEEFSQAFDQPADAPVSAGATLERQRAALRAFAADDRGVVGAGGRRVARGGDVDLGDVSRGLRRDRDDVDSPVARRRDDDSPGDAVSPREDGTPTPPGASPGVASPDDSPSVELGSPGRGLGGPAAAASPGGAPTADSPVSPGAGPLASPGGGPVPSPSGFSPGAGSPGTPPGLPSPGGGPGVPASPGGGPVPTPGTFITTTTTTDLPTLREEQRQFDVRAGAAEADRLVRETFDPETVAFGEFEDLTGVSRGRARREAVTNGPVTTSVRTFGEIEAATEDQIDALESVE